VEAYARLLHVDESGEVLDDTSSIFVSEETGELDSPDEIHASNALVDEDAQGDLMETGDRSEFVLSYDGLDQLVSVAVFDPEDSTDAIFTSELTFNVDATAFVQPDSTEFLMAVNASGADISDSLGYFDISEASYLPAGFRAGDMTLEWISAGSGSLTLTVTDIDNLAEVPFGEGIVDSTSAIHESEKTSNWSFHSISGGSIQPGGRYFLTTAPINMVDLWLCGFRIMVVNMDRMPQPGDVWTMRQAAYTVEVDTTVVPPDTTFMDAQRPPVPGARYRIDTVSGGPERGEVDLDLIRVVPNPYLASASFDPGPDQRRLEFINLPPECTIRIYTISGNLVCKLEHTSDEGGTEAYDLKTRENLPIASGNYYYHVTTPDSKTHLGRFAVVQ
jgi:hypothetical protein